MLLSLPLCKLPTSLTLPNQLTHLSIPTVLALGVLLYLHRRNVRRQRAEDANDRNFDLDFGIDEPNIPTKGRKRKSLMFGAEKGPSHKTSQLSMDMNLSSPYLLPPGIHGSRDSIHSVVRTFPSEHDPYRPVAQYTNSDAGSIRSHGRDGGSMYSGGMNSKRASVITGRSVGTFKRPPPRQNSIPQSPGAFDEKADPFATPTVPQRAHQSPQELDTKGSLVPMDPVIPEIDSVAVGYPDEKHRSGTFEMPDMQPPPRALARGSPDGARSPPSTQPPQFELPAVPHNNNIGMAHDGTDSFQFLPEHQAPGPAGLGLNLDLPQQQSPTTDSHAQSPPIPQFAHSYDNFGYDANQPQIQTSEHYEDDRGRSSEYHDQQGGLGVPNQDNKRLSVGFRPLPPDEITESEDPEYRANRIRSFYKEYFDDSKDAAPPMPSQSQGQYYEDYDSGYLGDAAYYDADTNAFVMPYAQPVTRRAMTPPPSGRRGPGGPPGPRRPRGPHGPHGSLGGMSMPGGGRPRAGSAAGPRGGYNSRAASSLGPRPGSSASDAWRRPKKNLPPPKALTTLPTPSKLRDDSFALMGATDFAPPDSFREHVTGRSQSPLGERRPYQPKLPTASPLVTAFDELAVLPSP